MLENVGYTRVIWRISLETNGEDIVFVISCDVQVLRPSLVMLQMECCELKLWDFLDTHQCEATVIPSRLKVIISLLAIKLLGKVSECSQPSLPGRRQRVFPSLVDKYPRSRPKASCTFERYAQHSMTACI